MDDVNKKTYNDIAIEFSETRAYVWQCVKDFTKFINCSNKEHESFILEIGCGNGKNMEYLNKNIDSECNVIGIDNCENFIEICKKKKSIDFELQFKFNAIFK